LVQINVNETLYDPGTSVMILYSLFCRTVQDAKIIMSIL